MTLDLFCLSVVTPTTLDWQAHFSSRQGNLEVKNRGLSPPLSGTRMRKKAPSAVDVAVHEQHQELEANDDNEGECLPSARAPANTTALQDAPEVEGGVSEDGVQTWSAGPQTRGNLFDADATIDEMRYVEVRALPCLQSFNHKSRRGDIDGPAGEISSVLFELKPNITHYGVSYSNCPHNALPLSAGEAWQQTRPF